MSTEQLNDQEGQIKILSFHDEPIIIENGVSLDGGRAKVVTHGANIDFNPKDNKLLALVTSEDGRAIMKAHAKAPISVVVSTANAPFPASQIEGSVIRLTLSNGLKVQIYWGVDIVGDEGTAGVLLVSLGHSFARGNPAGTNPHRFVAQNDGAGNPTDIDTIEFKVNKQTMQFFKKDDPKVTLVFK